MGRAKTIGTNSETEAVINRFFDAINVLIQLKKIRGRQTYCRLYNINKQNFYTQMKEPGRKMFEFDWITPLIKDFEVSADWLLTGRGEMFGK